MREIKFRAFRPCKNKMHKPATIDEIRFKYGQMNWDDLIWMQFTGLKDRNGVDIYEGDIVCDDLLGICQVKYNEIHAAFKVLHKNNRTAKWFVDYLPNEFKYLRVIGNIHENPELLK